MILGKLVSFRLIILIDNYYIIHLDSNANKSMKCYNISS